MKSSYSNCCMNGKYEVMLLESEVASGYTEGCTILLIVE